VADEWGLLAALALLSLVVHQNDERRIVTFEESRRSNFNWVASPTNGAHLCRREGKTLACRFRHRGAETMLLLLAVELLTFEDAFV